MIRVLRHPSPPYLPNCGWTLVSHRVIFSDMRNSYFSFTMQTAHSASNSHPFAWRQGFMTSLSHQYIPVYTPNFIEIQPTIVYDSYVICLFAALWNCNFIIAVSRYILWQVILQVFDVSDNENKHVIYMLIFIVIETIENI